MILDIGSGHLSSHIGRGDVNIDIERPWVKPENFVQADGYNLPFPDDLFDKTLLYDIIEHVDNPMKLMKEAFRVLKPNGTVLITTPNAWHWRKIFRVIRGKRIILGDTGHISTWTMAEIENLLINVGFENIVTDFITLPLIRAHGRHHNLDRFVENLLPKPIGMQSIRVRAIKCTKL